MENILTLKVAILIDDYKNAHSTNWGLVWENYCKNKGIKYRIINPYRSQIIDEIKDFDILLWHFNGYSQTDMLIAKDIIFSAKVLGLKVFPDFNEGWHFDNKIAQSYLFQAIGAKIPKSYKYYSLQELKEFSYSFENFPIIAKLRNGSGSHNVKMIKSKGELIDYGIKMFTSGFKSTPSPKRKLINNVRSLKSYNQLITRFKRIPEFIRTYSKSSKFSEERGYVLLQDYVPNDGFDIKIVVVGDKLSFVCRNALSGDFRASGAGDLFYNNELLSRDMIDFLFKLSDSLGFKCMGYDVVINNKNGEFYILEMSYGFSHMAILRANGFYNRQGEWENEPLNAPEEIIQNLLKTNN